MGENGFCDFGAEFATLTPIREAGQREAGSVKSAKNVGNSGFFTQSYRYGLDDVG